MAKQIKDFQVEVRKVGEDGPTGFVRYNVENTTDQDCGKYGELTQAIAGTDTVNTLLANVENAIKVAEGIV